MRPLALCQMLPLLVSVLAVSSRLLLCSAAPAPPSAVDEEFASLGFEESFLWNFQNPTDVQVAPNDDGNTMLLVAEKTGQLWVVENVSSSSDPIQTTLVIDLAPRMCVNGERGLGGVAFHPSYPTLPYIYMHYNYDKYNDCYNGENKRGLNRGPVNRLSRFVLDPKTKQVIESSEKVFLDTPRQPVHNHNGGSLAFGKDGLLYASLGDGGTRVWKNDLGVFYSQATSNLFGTIVRLTDEGEIPEENPFTPSQGHLDSIRCGDIEGEAPDAETKCQEIFAYGLRNPFRLAFDPDSAAVRFYINDVGRTRWEKVVEGRIGGNYGYPMQDGPCIYNRNAAPDCRPNNYTQDAVYWYPHDEENGGCITGGAFVSKDSGWPDIFRNAYIFAEYAVSGIHVMTKGSNGCDECNPPVPHYDTKVLSSNEKAVSMAFGPPVADGRSALYYVTRGKDGDRRNTAGLYRVAFTGTANRSPTANIDADVTYGFSPLLVNFDGTTSLDPDGDKLTFEWDFGTSSDTNFISTTSKASFQYTEAGTYMASLTVKDGNGGTDTVTIRIEVDNTPPLPVITSPSEGTLFSVGDVFVLEGSAADREDGDLDDSMLTWEVRQHHNNHWHPFLDPTSGNRIVLDGAPEPEDFDAATTSYLEILLTATDSTGLSTTASMKVMPKIVEFEFDTSPRGLKLIAYGDTISTPATILTWDNHSFEVEAPATIVECGEPFSFVSWSDGGERIHSFVASSRSRNNEDAGKPKLVALFQSDLIVGGTPSMDHYALQDQFSGKQSQNNAEEEEGEASSSSNSSISSAAPRRMFRPVLFLFATAAQILVAFVANL